jgi:hypothetical protein
MEEKFLGFYNFVAVAKTRCSGKPWAAVAGIIATHFGELLSDGCEIFDALSLVAWCGGHSPRAFKFKNTAAMTFE